MAFLANPYAFAGGRDPRRRQRAFPVPGRILTRPTGGGVVSDTTPDAFTIPAVTGATPLATVTSSSVTPEGYDTAAVVITTNCLVSVAGGDYVPLSVINPGQSFTLQATAPSGSSTTSTAYSISIGGVSASWSITTANTWTPADLGSKVALFLDATDTSALFQTDGATPVVEGGTLGVWKDSINTARQATQATGTKQFVWSATSYNNQPGLTLDGVDDTMSLTGFAAFADDGRYGMYLGSKNFNLTQGGVILNVRKNGNIESYFGNTSNLNLDVASSKFRLYSGTDATLDSQTSTQVHTVFGVERDGTTARAYMNGVLVDTSVAAPTPTVGSNATVWIGSNRNTGSWHKGTIQWILLLNEELTDTERQNLQTWAVAEQGPADINLGTNTAWVGAETTGSMTQGSNILAVANTASFPVGSYVVVPPTTGYKTIGPGGVVPTRSVASVADLPVSPVTGAWRIASGDAENGKVYYGVSGSWATDTDAGSFYNNKAVPLALRAYVSARSVASGAGNLTLVVSSADGTAVNAQVAVPAGSPVYRDVEPVWTAAVAAMANGATITIPAGTFWIGAPLRIFNRSGIIVNGSGKTTCNIKSAAGTRSGIFMFSGCNGVTLKNLKTWGTNRGVNGGNIATETTDLNQKFFPSWDIDFTNCYSVLCEDVNMDNPLLGISFGNSNGLANRVATVTNYAHMSYIQWGYTAVNCTGGVEYRDCSWTADKAIKVMHGFQTSNLTYTRFTGQNTWCAFNSCSDFLIDEPVITITANCTEEATAPTGSQFTTTDPVIGINNNINASQGAGVSSADAEIRNGTINVQDYINSAGAAPALLKFGGQPGILVSGTYNPLVADDGLRKGYYRAPYAKNGSVSANGSDKLRYGAADWAQVIGSDSYTEFNGIRVESYALTDADLTPSTPAIVFYGVENNTTNPGLKAIHCIADSISARSGNSGNITNAAYDAL